MSSEELSSTAARRQPPSLELQPATVKKLMRRLLPLLILGYIIAYLDRANIGFAKAGMSEELAMSATAFGFAAGIFSLGYVLVEVPSNLLLNRFGARRWLSRIMVSWGICSMAMVFVTDPTGVYIIRFLLGVAEAGFFPGVILYISQWFPNDYRARVTSYFMLAIPAALAFGGLLNGWILDTLNGALGIHGWKWLFIVGGLLSVVCGIVYFFRLVDRPSDARWLRAPERDALVSVLEAEAAVRAQRGPHRVLQVLRDRRVLMLALVYFLYTVGASPLIIWLPTVVGNFAKQFSGTQVGLVVAVPYALTGLAVYILARKLGRRDGQIVHIVTPMVISAAAFLTAPLLLGTPTLAFVVMTVAVVAGLSTTQMFWSLPTHYLTGVAAAAGIALVNSLGNIAGFVSPYTVGFMTDAFHGDTITPLIIVLVVSFGLAIAALLALRYLPGLRLDDHDRVAEPTQAK